MRSLNRRIELCVNMSLQIISAVKCPFLLEGPGSCDTLDDLDSDIAS